MTKYSKEFKLNVVLEYLNGSLGFKLLAKKYDIKSKTQISKWVNQYKQHGEKGLEIKRTKTNYPLNFKLDVLKFKQETGASYKDTANAFGITNPSMISNWKRKYIKDGAAGLNNSIGRPSTVTKPKKTNQSKTNDKTNKSSELEKLKQENEYLKIEVAYLKKLKSLGLKDPRENNNQ